MRKANEKINKCTNAIGSLLLNDSTTDTININIANAQ
jgi:hypothetical protein